MDTIKKLKLAIYEAHSEKLIDDKTSDTMIEFCESANIDDIEDRKMLTDITNTLIEIKESVTIEEPVKTAGDIALEIFESERAGEITADERDELLNMLSNK